MCTNFMLGRGVGAESPHEINQRTIREAPCFVEDWGVNVKQQVFDDASLGDLVLSQGCMLIAM